jgi:hypothetical protein
MPMKIYKNTKDSYPGLELPKHGGKRILNLVSLLITASQLTTFPLPKKMYFVRSLKTEKPHLFTQSDPYNQW